MRTALAPVANALRENAQREAAAIAAGTDGEAQAALSKSAATAAAIVAQARADGEAFAGRSADSALATARREQRETILAARRRVYEAVRSGVLAELARRIGTPEVTALITRLGDAARAQLGTQANVQPIAAPRIGVRAVAGTRSIEATIDPLVDLELARASAAIEALWT